jgi:hypothetical protein
VSSAFIRGLILAFGSGYAALGSLERELLAVSALKQQLAGGPERVIPVCGNSTPTLDFGFALT